MIGDQLIEKFEISKILNGNLGALPSYRGFSTNAGFLPAIKFGLCYLGLIALLPLFVGVLVGASPNLTLIGLSVWGAGYIFFATWTATSTSSRVRSDLCHLSDYLAGKDKSKQLQNKLISKYGGWSPDIVALVASLLGLVPTVGALASDLDYIKYSVSWTAPPATTLSVGPFHATLLGSDIAVWEWGFFALGFFVLYFTAARCTFVATFVVPLTAQISPSTIAECYDPKSSPEIVYCTDISRSLLLFWAGISISIATLPVVFSSLSDFLQIVVSTTVFFSLGVGVAVYLVSERQVRCSVRDAVAGKLSTIHRQISEIEESARPDEIDERTHGFLLAHRGVLTANPSLGSYVLTLASLMLPLIGTFVKVIVDWQLLSK